MDVQRVRSEQDARELRRELRRQEREHRDGPVRHASDVAAPTGAGTADVVAEGADGIDLDPEEIATAERELGKLYYEIASYLQQAQQLAGPLGDGKGPVARHLRRAFGLRGGEDPGGVQAALRAYLEELAGLRDAISRVGAVHQASDDEAAATMNTQQTQLDQGAS